MIKFQQEENSPVQKGKNFEIKIEKLLTDVNIKCEITGGPSNKGIDIKKMKKSIKFIIECKNWRTKNIDCSIINQIEGVLNRQSNGTIGIIMVPSMNKYTPGAKETARMSIYNIIFVDMNNIVIKLNEIINKNSYFFGPSNKGIDIKKMKKSIKFIIECKNWRTKNIDCSIINQIEGVLNRQSNGTIGIIMVPSMNKYTPGAKETARTSIYNVILVDVNNIVIELNEIINKYQEYQEIQKAEENQLEKKQTEKKQAEEKQTEKKQVEENQVKENQAKEKKHDL
ncbi:hypothetical protein Glove_302g5 [Diversispora epigaea]|uniref:Restriction endonuclease type IV Mrr domain-containing protein n=1 Tax=Diversispora epigaea TaxID=1348612 RepID=A0A397HWN6_9GLOM|nr:hypothetical protein Glove_302g5 [Diversispora epigaea]